ncbi:MEDS domain-containing protein [Niastella sp. OAS944]|uniref:MEDS domain-containing protein n=1 Tax=Niastella sp. OAS944 TaxID=2664089 RepID=UPI003472987D|nr:hypothetical protein [Chitinophagaceae bacterium OAS944]
MNSLKNDNTGWETSSNEVFWGEIAPCEHVVQIYEHDEDFLDLLTGFVNDGINAGECSMVIATAAHLTALNERLIALGHHIPSLMSKTQYIPLDAEETLSKFMINDWPDQHLFQKVISELLIKAKGNGRRVRAFGEMVAILWAKGQIGATVRLEHIWNKFCETETFCLFCAYPQSGFTHDAAESVMHICSAHTKMIKGAAKGKTGVSYKIIDKKL